MYLLSLLYQLASYLVHNILIGLLLLTMTYVHGTFTNILLYLVISAILIAVTNYIIINPCTYFISRNIKIRIAYRITGLIYTLTSAISILIFNGGIAVWEKVYYIVFFVAMFIWIIYKTPNRTIIDASRK